MHGPITMVVQEPSGLITGTLSDPSGKVPVVGRFKDEAVNLAFSLPHGAHVFGTGSFAYDAATHRVEIGGTLTGPRPGDIGDWDVLVQLPVPTATVVPQTTPAALNTIVPHMSSPTPPPVANPGQDPYGECLDGIDDDPFICQKMLYGF